MKVGDRNFRTIWLDAADNTVVQLIDQRKLPHDFVIEDIRTPEEMATAIREMHVRGAGLIGAAAGYGLYLAALRYGDSFEEIRKAAALLAATRPTAVNLAWAIERQLKEISRGSNAEERIRRSRETAEAIANEDAASCQRIGEYGVALIRQLASKKNGQTVNVLTHCNAGWLAFVDYGSATAPIYAAHGSGLPVHVWVNETRPRGQGSKLTAWELGQEGVPHTVIADNAAGHLMQRGLVDLVLVGTDRTTYTGDVANKIGTYMKALAAADNNVPFYVALPSSSFDWQTRNGRDIPIEERSDDEVKAAEVWSNGVHHRIALAPNDSPASNFAFDVTPRHLITGLITERGICPADEISITGLFPERIAS
jgi:methylthioribose-1-phosphate isomerase